MSTNLPSWEEVFSDSDFGDIRRNARIIKLANTIEDKYTRSASSSLPDKASLKAASRFLNLKVVTPDSLTDKFIEYNFKNLKSQHVLVLQDTSEINFSWRKEIEDLGPVGREGNQGFFIHPGLIVNPDNSSVLGLASLSMWSRVRGEKTTSNDKHKKKPIEEKESYKWFTVPEAVKKYSNDDTTYTIVGDRESDIYEFMLAHQEGRFGTNCELLIRASQNRKIVDDNHSLIFSAIDSWPVQGEYSIAVKSNHKRIKREAQIDVKFGELKLAPLKNKAGQKFNAIEKIYAVDAREHNTPEGQDPIHWTLLTTWEITNFEEAVEKINWYQNRWFIEELFRILKSGYKVENVKFDTAQALMNWCALRLMMAVKILYLLKQRDVIIKDSAIPLFSKQEIQLLEKLEDKLISKNSKINRPPEKSIAWAVLIIAILGGYKAVPSAAPPGQESLWRGLDRLEAALLGFSLSS